MNDDELIAIFFKQVSPDWTRRDDRTIEMCLRMMRAAVSAEREACAQVCEQLTVLPEMQAFVSTQCASEIRMRANAQ